MRTAQEREDSFRLCLAQLLKEHGAELMVTDDGKSYGMHCGVCEITMDGQWDEEGNQTSQYTEFRI